MKSKQKKKWYLVKLKNGKSFVQDCFSYSHENGKLCFHQTIKGGDCKVSFPSSEVESVELSKEDYQKVHLV